MIELCFLKVSVPPGCLGSWGWFLVLLAATGERVGDVCSVGIKIEVLWFGRAEKMVLKSVSSHPPLLVG